MNDVLSVLNGLQTVSVTDALWGDGGKGKIVDLFAPWADIIARGTGGDNAGHTVIKDGKAYALHLIPCGIFEDNEGKMNVIGRGVAVNPHTLAQELAMLRSHGRTYNNLRVSNNALLILPHEIALDLLEETSKQGVGSTRRGIGPVFTDQVARYGLTVNDLLNPDAFASNLKRSLEKCRRLFAGYDPERVKETLFHERLANGVYWKDGYFDIHAIIDMYLMYARDFAHLIDDTDKLMHEAYGKKRILLEGAQGLLLSVKYGTYPYVTSSDCSPEGLAAGVGFHKGMIDKNFSVVKFLPTRVGFGPFPTEIGGSASERWCNPRDSDPLTEPEEQEHFGDVSANDPNPLKQSYALRSLGREYGATTGRPRRIGWPDTVMLRYAVKIQGPDIIIMKPDPYGELDEVNICGGYDYCGQPYRIARRRIINNARIFNTDPNTMLLNQCKPTYMTRPGWKGSLNNITSFQDLPINLKIILNHIARMGNANLRLVSIGPKAEATLLVD